MNPEEFFAVIGEQIVGLELRNSLPEEFLRAIPRQLTTVLNTPTLAIGGWENSSDGPLVLGLDANGQMVSVVSVNPTQLDSVGDTLASIDFWLSTMTLPSLSELSGNTIDFYEGLLELSPHSSIVLSRRRRFVLLTAVSSLDTAGLEARLPDADIDVHYLDVLQAPGGPAIVRGRSAAATVEAPPVAHVAEAEPVLEPSVAHEVVDDELVIEQPLDGMLVVEEPLDEVPVDEVPVDELLVVEEQVTSPDQFSIAPETDAATDLTDPAEHADPSAIDLTAHDDETTIDLDDDIHAPSFELEQALPPVEQGGTYGLDLLPLLFDATGTTLESISNELFAVNGALVIVAKLPERRRDTPFEDRRRFRWDTSLERIQLLNEHGFTASGDRRAVHLFVESDRQPDYAVYVGELSRTAFQTQTRVDGETAWFSISPNLSHDLYRLLRKGRLPQFDDGRTVDITAL